MFLILGQENQIPDSDGRQEIETLSEVCQTPVHLVKLDDTKHNRQAIVHFHNNCSSITGITMR